MTTLEEQIAHYLRGVPPKPWVKDLHPLQYEVARSLAQWRVVTSSRRWGKTVLLAALAGEGLEDCRHDEGVVYLARTRMVARDLIWGKLQALSAAHGLGWRFHEQQLRVETARGGVLYIRGAEGGSPGEELHKLRGLKLRRALVDEPATYAETLGALLRDVLEPALGDLRGDCIVVGTPGLVCAGTWHELSTGKREKWRRWHGDLRSNPHFPDAEQYLASVRQENGWDEDNATYRREYLGQWVVDETAQVYRYDPARNDVAELEGYDSPRWVNGRWVHTIGVDFGMVDSSAWVVLGSHPHSREVVVLEAFKRPGLLPEETSAVTRELVERYAPYVLVGDAGGLGKPYVEHYNSRHFPGVQMVAAEKAEKRAHIELMNGDLRSGRLKLLRPACDALAEEWLLLPWADETRQREHPAYENHLADAALYAWRHHHAYLHAKPAEQRNPARLEPDDPEYRERELEELREEQRREWWDAQ